MSKIKSLFPKSVDFKAAVSRLLKDALNSVDPDNLVLNCISLRGNILTIKNTNYELSGFNKIHVLGVGKGATYLYFGLKKILHERIWGGMIISIEENGFSDKRVKFYPGSHPLPDGKSLSAGRQIAEYAETQIGSDDLVFFLITGGASALMVLPHPELRFADNTEINKLLLSSGAQITDINCVRKHISAIKGGRLAELIYPAKIISLILSDVIDSPLEDIGSGPSIGDSTSYLSAKNILHKFKIWEKCSPQIQDFFARGTAGKIPDTPSPASEKLKKNDHFIIGDNFIALNAAKISAEKMGIPVVILTSSDCGEAGEAAKIYSAIIKEIIASGNPFTKPILLLSGGELTVTIRNSAGKGGRNQEFILHMLKELQDFKHPFYAISIGTDGIDGPTDAAGAWIDEKTGSKVQKAGIEINNYLSNNDSYNFFKKIGQLVITGPTHTNVMDLRMFFIS